MFARLAQRQRAVTWAAALLLAALWFVVYLTTVSPTVNFIDSGELITALQEPGIAHPPGYPLYVLLGYVVSHLLWGEVAWRVNVFSAFWGAAAVGAFFTLIVRLAEYVLAESERKRPLRSASRPQTTTRARARKSASAPAEQAVTGTQPRTTSMRFWVLLAGAASGASLLAASSTFWSRTAQAKMYSLHYFFVALLLLLALRARRAYEAGDGRGTRAGLISLAAVFGLSFTNHLMTLIVVVPAAVLLFFGSDMRGRWQAFVRALPFTAPAFFLPLLLYLYMPLRASQYVIMNWGQPDSWGDFWRHVTAWQFRTYLTSNPSEALQRNIGTILGYAAEQWSLLTALVVLAAIFAAALLARRSSAAFAATLGYALATLLFALFYGISEIEPYITPLYVILCVWLGMLPVVLWSLAGGQRAGSQSTPQRPLDRRIPAAVAAAVMLVALGSAVLIYPAQNYRENRLAEQFARNVFSELPTNSILITDYWDFYAPTYYLQILKNERPDIAIVDKSLLRYPWYTTQLQRRYPWLIENSQDIVSTFSAEQRKWVEGQPFDVALLNNSYLSLLTSFVERNHEAHPAYLFLMTGCDPSLPAEQCENNQIAPTWYRRPTGITLELLPSAPPADEMPAEPSYRLEGILSNPVHLDTFARENTSIYITAYSRLAAIYNSGGQSDKAQRMARLADSVRRVVESK